jgi:hypothetical protein
MGRPAKEVSIKNKFKTYQIKRMMKIFKTKKVIFAIVTAFVLLSTLPFLQSCSNSDEPTTLRPDLEKRIKYISKSEIPKGVIPIQLNNMDELYALIERMDIIKVVGVNIDNFKNKRFKAKGNMEVGTVNTTADVYGSSYVINIHLPYDLNKHEASVSSENSETWHFSSWTQTSGVATINDNKIDYSLTGDLIWYAIVSWNFIEIDRKNIPVSGKIQY